MFFSFNILCLHICFGSKKGVNWARNYWKKKEPTKYKLAVAKTYNQTKFAENFQIGCVSLSILKRSFFLVDVAKML